jgi:guanylate kinase
VGIFLEAPSLEVLLERWEKRGDYIDPVTLAARTTSYYKEMAARFSFEYCVMNDNFEECVNEVTRIIKAN